MPVLCIKDAGRADCIEGTTALNADGMEATTGDDAGGMEATTGVGADGGIEGTVDADD